ncbi:MAG TPA: restriction endonuclease [Pyrinomonadaceae bacterium]|jgi:hypothetical protein|nr:restriction endonuclease [Pyrinomonadaceae bacterium]
MTEPILEVRDVAELPDLARIAFGARCVRRVHPLLAVACPFTPTSFLQDIDHFISNAEQYAGTGNYMFYTPVSHERDRAWLSMKLEDMPAMERHGSKGQGVHIDMRKNKIGDDILNAAIAIRGAAHYRANSSDDWFYWVTQAIAFAFRAYARGYETGLMSSRIEDFNSYVLRDIRLLRNAAQRDHWDSETPVAPQFFSLHSEFETERIVGGQTIIQISEFLTAEIVKHFLAAPQDLFRITPRQFEELVAKLFDGFGYTVELTAPTRDDGRDIIAVRHDVANARYLIECKRYSPGHKVGVAAVQRLQGITLAEGANKGILATTSEFTDPALAAMKKTPWLLEGRDFYGILQWLDEYQKQQMNRLIRPF